MNDNEIRYYYKDSKGQTQGGVSKDELRKLNLNSSTLVWHKGLADWVTLSTIFPIQKSSFNKGWILLVCGIVAIVSLILLVVFGNSLALHTKLKNNSYASEEFDMYLNKYYRDLEAFGISVVKSRSVSIRFAQMQYFEDTKDYYGLCYGYNNDDIIEIYINEDAWKSLTRAQKYLIMYHELSHDVLNVVDLPNIYENREKLMCPSFNRFDKLTMDDFIEITHDFFEKYININK